MAGKKKNIIGSFLDGLFGGSLLSGITNATDGVLAKTQEKIYETKRKILKDLSVYSIIFIATIFLLIGVSKYVESYYQTFPGGGMVIVAGGLYLLALVYRAFSK